jgi:formiminotetrahydrofolate cyclodeaminase
VYINGSIKEYLNDLAARKPAPGGGSAAALSASIGAALISMVANYTAGNPKYAANDQRARKILAASEDARKKLEALVDADVEAYNRLSSAMKAKKASIEEDYKAALKPPYDICAIAADCMKLCEELIDVGNRNLITDTAIAATLLEGAFFSAKFNVYINLKYIQDNAYIEKIHKALSPLEEKLPKMKEEILERCEGAIG